MTIGQDVQIYDGLNRFLQQKPNLDCFKLYYAIRKSREAIEDEIKELREKYPRHKDTKEYEVAIKELIDVGKWENSQEADDLKIKWAEVIAFNNEIAKKLESVFQDESVISLYYLKSSDMKDSNGNTLALNKELTDLIYPIIKD
jgi:ferredoxin-NADP reductase